MIITNKLTKIHYEGFPPGNTQWPLASYIPEGVLDPSHLEVRWRTATTYWSAWFPSLIQWDEATKIGTWVPVGFSPSEVEIRRVTPRYSLWRDPEDPTSRVSQPHLQVNADQGLMVALEWAAEYGVDGHSDLIPGEGPALTGSMHTQNHWGPETDFHAKVWNFQFTGGYLNKTHVRAQARVGGVWQSLPIDYAPPPVASPFRLHGEYQLFLDLSTLDGVVDGLIIFRRTIREIHVPSPSDKAEITGPNMEPSARHSFFVAVELGEVMSRMVPDCECDLTYTTTIKPVLAEEALVTGNLLPIGAWELGPVTDFMSRGYEPGTGVLRDILITLTIDQDVMLRGHELGSGTMVDTGPAIINMADKLARGHEPKGGTLTTTIVYVTYNYSGEVLARGHELKGGTLT